MKKGILFIWFIVALISCRNPAPDKIESSTPAYDFLRTYVMGHSLLNHEHHVDDNSYSTNETSVFYWLSFLMEEADLDYSVSGQYGFLPGHSQLPPVSQWGAEHYSSPWDNDDGSLFGDIDFNTFILTAGNFIQYQSPEENYYQTLQSPMDHSEIILNWITEQEPGISLFIYENWPDMGGYITPDENDLLVDYVNAASSYTEIDNYHEYLLGDFHDWWLEYLRLIKIDYPETRMIPAGPIIAELIDNTAVGNIPLAELYEDSPPHGRPNIYLLAAIICYMDILEVSAPVIELPEIISPYIRNNYSTIVSYIDQRLQYYHNQFEQF